MATDDGEQSPFARPGFIAAAGVVALVVVLGLVLVIVNARDDVAGPTPAPSASASVNPTSQSTPVASHDSVCGLDGSDATGSVTTAPEAQWAFQGTIGYPISSTYGPGETSPEGVRSCFQRSPIGALFMAANAVAQGSDPATSAHWVSQALAEGEYREQLLAQMRGGTSSEGTRLSIAGFRVLKYDGDTARIDLGANVSSGGQNVTMSAVYELVWQGGDWKISSDVAAPIDAASIPDLAAYIPWGE